MYCSVPSALLRHAPKSSVPSIFASPRRFFSTPPATPSTLVRPRRAMMYVPGSDQRKLRKAIDSKIDALALDLEDSVAVDKKGAARELVLNTLNAVDPQSRSEKLVRINGVDTGLAEDDLQVLLPLPRLQGIVIPKVHSKDEIEYVDSLINKFGNPETKDKIAIIASIESAKGILNLRQICQASKRVDSLLFAAEDYCADVGIRRTKTRLEMLYPRQAIVTAAKAHGLKALDMVCIDYSEAADLEQECMEGSDMGFDGKQCIHPGQINTIQHAYSPSKEVIDRAVRIMETYKEMQRGGKGASKIEDAKGRKTMIDAPVILQARSILAKARAAGIDIPEDLE